MFEKISLFEKKFILSNYLLYSGDYIFTTFLSIFLWSEGGALHQVLIFNFVMYLSFLLGIVFSEFLLQRISAKFIRIFGNSIFIPIGLIMINIELTTLSLVFLGIAYGMASGLRSQAFWIFYRFYLKTDFVSRYESTMSMLQSFITVSMPLVSALLVVIFGGSFVVTFIIGMIFIFLSAIPLLSIKSQDEHQEHFSPAMSIREFVRNSELKKVFLFKVYDGTLESINIVLFGIIVISILGGVGVWGYFTAFVALLQVIISYMVGKKLNLGKSRLAYSISTFLLSIGCIFFSIQFSVLGLVIYTLLASPYNSLHKSIAGSFIESSIDRNLAKSEFADELYFFFYIATTIGRILPIALLLVLELSFDNNFVLRAVIIVIGIFTQLLLSQVASMNIVKQRDIFAH